MIRPRIAICTALEDRSPIEAVCPNWRQIDFSSASGPTEVIVIAAVNDASAETRRRFARLLAPWPVAAVEVADIGAMVPQLQRADDPSWNQGTEMIRSHKRAALRAAVQRAGLQMEVDWFLWLDSDNAIPANGFHCLVETMTAACGRFTPRVVCGLYGERRTGELLAGRWGKHGPGVPPMALFPDSIRAIGYMGFGCVLVHRDIMAVPVLDFLQLYTEWRDRRRILVELDGDRVKPGIWTEDTYWLYACEEWTGVPLYCDTRVLSEHWRDEFSCWEVVERDGELLCQLRMTNGTIYQRGDPDIPPARPGERPEAELVSVQEAAG